MSISAIEEIFSINSELKPDSSVLSAAKKVKILRGISRAFVIFCNVSKFGVRLFCSRSDKYATDIPAKFARLAWEIPFCTRHVRIALPIFKIKD